MKNYLFFVEDGKTDVELIERLFRTELKGYSYGFATTYDEAIEIFESEELLRKRPAVIFMDIKLVGGDGIELLHLLRSKQFFADIPVVMLSSSDRSSEIEKAYQLGANSFLEKPKNYPDLKVLLKDVIKYWTEYNVQIADDRRRN